MTERTPRDDEPGGETTPLDTRGDGPVGLQDRVSGDTKGSPATNQGKTEPMPSTPGHRDPSAPLEPPLLEEMNVGVTDPQRPSRGGPGLAAGDGAAAAAGAPTDLTGAGVAPHETRPTLAGDTSGTGPAGGVEAPSSSSAGRSHRAPGLMGESSPAEQVETDVEDSAAAMARDTGRPSGSGDAQGVGVPGQTPSRGTSQEHGVVQGARIPRSDGAGQDG